MARHTFISLMAEAGVDQTTIKKIVGHQGAMTLTERVYTHLDVNVLIDAVNKSITLSLCRKDKIPVRF